MDGVVAKIGERIIKTSVLGETGPEIPFIKRLGMRMGVGLVRCFSGLYLRNLNKRSDSVYEWQCTSYQNKNDAWSI